METYLKEESVTLSDKLETWRPIVGFEGRYEVSDEGRVRSMNYRGSTGLVVVMKTFITKCGYELVQLGVGRKRYGVHCLVAEAFIGPRPNGMEVNHKDGNKRNNIPKNLEYLTPGDNQRHAFAIGLRQRKRGEDSPMHILKERDVREIHRLYISEGVLQRELAKIYNTRQSQISQILLGKRWKHIHQEIHA